MSTQNLYPSEHGLADDLGHVLYGDDDYRGRALLVDRKNGYCVKSIKTVKKNRELVYVCIFRHALQ